MKPKKAPRRATPSKGKKPSASGGMTAEHAIFAELEAVDRDYQKEIISQILEWAEEQDLL